MATIGKVGTRAVANEEAENKAPFFERMRDFFKDVRNEMRKVNTPSVKEVRATTAVVIITVFLFALYFFGVDKVLGLGIDNLLKWAKTAR